MSTVEIRYSDDGGYNFSNWRSGDLGDEGKYGQRVVFRRLGVTRDRVFHIRVSDPVKRDVIAASMQVEIFGQ